jgi:hypothetical protein
MRHVDTPEPQGFAERWISAWNARYVEAVLTLYAEDVLFTSPTAQRVVPKSGGTVQGKQALRSYWTLRRWWATGICTSCRWASTTASTPSSCTIGTS